MARVKGMLSGLQERIDGVFYKCEYLKECDKVTPQCDMEETVTAVNTKKESAEKARKANSEPTERRGLFRL